MEKMINPVAQKAVSVFFENVKLVKEQASDKIPTVPRELVFEYMQCPFEIPYYFNRSELFFYTPRYGLTGPLGLFLFFFERFKNQEQLLVISDKKKQGFFNRLKKMFPFSNKKKQALVRVSPLHFSNPSCEKSAQEMWIEEVFIRRIFKEAIDSSFENNFIDLNSLKPNISICVNEYTQLLSKEKKTEDKMEIPFHYNDEEVLAVFNFIGGTFVLDKLVDNTSSLRKANYSFYEFERIFHQQTLEHSFHFLSLRLPTVHRKELFRLYGEVLKNGLTEAVNEESKRNLKRYAFFQPLPSLLLETNSFKQKKELQTVK